ncbi:MAG: hypothetical protein R3324_19445, partial [Halobacteriales archaeon]|nr:hypothetical protein [Halobacteriales archaeon]
DAETPAGGYMGTPFGRRLVVPVCEFDDEFAIESIELHPGRLNDEPISHWGVPTRVTGDEAESIIEYLGELSAPFGTDVTYEDGTGLIEA